MNEVRLIDANALKKALQNREECKECTDIDCIHCFYDIIDNAPTVEPCYQTTSCLDCDNYDKENHNCPRYCEVIRDAIKSRPQGEFTDLEREVIADSINYLLGAELLEENGYTEEVITALKSVLSKIGADMRGKEE